MKVIFVTPAYRPSFFEGGKGGGEISNQILFDALARLGEKVYVISMRNIQNKKVYRDGKIVVIEPFSDTNLTYLSLLASFFLFKNVLFELLKKTRPDIVLSTTSVVRVTAENCAALGVRHGAVVRAMENLPGHGWKSDIKSPASVAKFLLHKATIGWPGERELDKVDFIIANSEFMKGKYLEEFPGKPISVVYPALDLEKSTMPPPKVIKRVMMVGTSKEKGYDIFKELSAAFPELEFHAIGDKCLAAGSTRQDGKVIVHGWLKKPSDFIDQMDLVLVPSQWEEPFGRISIEALYRNKHVLVSAKGGLPETVRFRGACVVHNNDIDSWVNSVKHLVETLPHEYKAYADWVVDFNSFSLEEQALRLKFILRLHVESPFNGHSPGK
jgi:glycosyltransferase involved in cell wall biosynthesis